MSLPSPFLRITGWQYLYSREYMQPELREKRVLRAALDGTPEEKLSKLCEWM